MKLFYYIYTIPKFMAKKETKRLNIIISPEVYKKLEEGNYNKNKLIISLLKDYLLKNIKKNVSLP